MAIRLIFASGMAVTMESEVWEPKPQLFVFLFCSCLLSIFLPSYFSNNSRTSACFDLGTGSSPSFLRFQRKFLLMFSLASVIEGLESVFGEDAYYGCNKEQIVVFLCVGAFAALLFGTLLGMLSDVIGQKKICVMFCILHLLVSIWRSVSMNRSAWIASISLALASSVFMFSFETLMVKEHEKLGHRLDLLNDTFWLMEFYKCASLIGSQLFANLLAGGDIEKRIGSPFNAVALLSIICIVYIVREWRESPPTTSIKDYKISFSACIIRDKRVWLLTCAQSCLQFSITIFWILWAPTIVADGREVHLGMLFPVWMGAKMLGITAVPWLLSGPSQSRTEDCLTVAFLISGLIFSIVAYDYQGVGVLVILFCLYHACVGLITPSLARLRTMYVPNDLRGGMIGLSLAPANAAVLLVLIQGGYKRSLGNASIMAFTAFGLFAAAGCMHMLKQSGKQPRENSHKL